MLGWVGEWCVGVWYDIFIIKNVLVKLCKLGQLYFQWARVSLFQHIPEFDWLVLEDVWEIEL